MRLVALFLALLVLPASAQAQWRVATSEHFVVYSGETEASLRAQMVKLETFHKIVHAFSGTKKAGSPLKLTVFQVRDMNAVAATLPYESYGIGGYYSSTLRGPFLVATRRSYKPANTMKTDTTNVNEWGPEVLQHEYVHHLMYQYFPGLYPSWYSEGFAEFYGTMQFGAKGVVEMGHAPLNRMRTIQSEWLPMRKMLTAKSYADVGDQIGSLYAQGWLLTHYCSFNKERGAQLKTYLQHVAEGMSYADAAKKAFGENLEQLDKELKDHAKNLKALRLSLKPQDVGQIAVRDLTKLENALLQTEIKLNSGFRRSDLPLVVSSIMSAMTASPNDSHGLSILMEVQRIAGQYADSSATADKLLAVQPGNRKAGFHKAMNAVDQLAAAKSTDAAAWDKARAGIMAAIKAAPDTPQFLAGYYQSFRLQGQLPPVGAQNGLVRAHQLLPQNGDLRYGVALDYEQRNMIDEAMFVISPEAFGTFDGDEKEAKDRKRDLQRAASKITGITIRETGLDMYKRLQEKQKGAASASVASGGK